MKYAYYDTEIAAIQIVNFLPSQIGVNVWFEVADTVAPDDVYITSGVLKYYPPRPGPWSEFDYSTDQWVDPRTVEDYNQYMAAVRAVAVAPKSQILTVLAEQAFLPDDEIISIGSGILPASLLAQIPFDPDDPTGMNVMRARIAWLSDTEVSRMSIIMLAIQAHIGAPDWQIDVMFGIEMDPPPAT